MLESAIVFDAEVTCPLIRGVTRHDLQGALTRDTFRAKAVRLLKIP